MDRRRISADARLAALGLAMTVAPLTAAVLGAVESGHAVIASGVNNAVARVANLVAIAAVGAVVAGHYATALDSRPPASPARHHAGARPLVVDASGFPPPQRRQARAALIRASVDSYRLAIEIAAGLAFLSGAISLDGIANAPRKVVAAGCPGGALCGASTDVAGAPVPLRVAARS